jgi:hypothetical protein
MSPSQRFGPHTHEIERAFVTWSDIRWLAHLGEPLHDDRVVAVASWADAQTIWNDELHYNDNGVLLAPCARADKILAQLPDRTEWWYRARDEAKRYEDLSPLPSSLAPATRELLTSHFYELVSMLLVEILVSPEAGSTYFRDQLDWLVAGRFPCGWVGRWPRGRMRVY